jgi:hypothetical protein
MVVPSVKLSLGPRSRYQQVKGSHIPVLVTQPTTEKTIEKVHGKNWRQDPNLGYLAELRRSS